jgi:hypothetical protein
MYEIWLNTLVQLIYTNNKLKVKKIRGEEAVTRVIVIEGVNMIKTHVWEYHNNSYCTIKK